MIIYKRPRLFSCRKKIISVDWRYDIEANNKDMCICGADLDKISKLSKILKSLTSCVESSIQVKEQRLLRQKIRFRDYDE